MNIMHELTKDNFSKINKIMENLEEPDEEIEKENQIIQASLAETENAKVSAKNHGKKLKQLLEKWCESEDYK